MKIYQSTVLVIFVLLLAGCATVQPLSPEQKSTIRAIYVKNAIDEEAAYLKYGTTIFQNTKRQPLEGKLVDDYLEFVANNLNARGYTITARETDADTVLEVESYLPSIPYTASVRGIGLFVHKTVLFNTGVQLQTNVCFRIKRQGSKDALVTDCIGGVGLETGIKENPDDWGDYPVDTRSLLIEKLKNRLYNESIAAFDERSAGFAIAYAFR